MDELKPRKGKVELRQPEQVSASMVFDDREMIEEYNPDLSVKWYEHPKTKRIAGAVLNLVTLFPGLKQIRGVVDAVRDKPDSNIWQMIVTLIKSIVDKFKKK